MMLQFCLLALYMLAFSCSDVYLVYKFAILSYLKFVWKTSGMIFAVKAVLSSTYAPCFHHIPTSHPICLSTNTFYHTQSRNKKGNKEENTLSQRYCSLFFFVSLYIYFLLNSYIYNSRYMYMYNTTYTK